MCDVAHASLRTHMIGDGHGATGDASDHRVSGASLGVFLLDESGTVVAATRDARAQIDPNGDVPLLGSRFDASGLGFDSGSSDVKEPMRALPWVGIGSLKREAAPPVDATWIVLGAGESVMDRNLVHVVAILAPEAASPLAEERLSAMFRLTQRERLASMLLASGLGVPAIAREMGIKQNTVRLFLKQAFSKTGVTNQASLVSLIFRTAIAPIWPRKADGTTADPNNMKDLRP